MGVCSSPKPCGEGSGPVLLLAQASRGYDRDLATGGLFVVPTQMIPASQGSVMSSKAAVPVLTHKIRREGPSWGGEWQEVAGE